MPYCSVSDVRRALGTYGISPPLSDTDILAFITSAQEYINLRTGTVYWSIEDSGTASAGGSGTLTDSSKSWTTNQYENYTLWIYSGTGSGQYRQISSNTGTILSVLTNFSTTPDNTSKYKIFPPSYLDITIDGSGKDSQMFGYYPIRNINSLSVDGVSVTPSTLLIYEDVGLIQLTTSSNASYFSNRAGKLVNIKYFYGVYPVPTTLVRYASLIASMNVLTALMGNRVLMYNSITLPELSATQGEPHIRIKGVMDALQTEIDKYELLFRRNPYLVIG